MTPEWPDLVVELPRAWFKLCLETKKNSYLLRSAQSSINCFPYLLVHHIMDFNLVPLVPRLSPFGHCPVSHQWTNGTCGVLNKCYFYQHSPNPIWDQCVSHYGSGQQMALSKTLTLKIIVYLNFLLFFAVNVKAIYILFNIWGDFRDQMVKFYEAFFVITF